MSHQPFDTWLLDETNLSPQQEADLTAHLVDCPQCRQLQAGWQAAQNHLRTSRLVSPAPGFSRRFNASLTERRIQLAHQKQIRRLILGLSLTLIASAALLGILVFSVNSPVDFLIRATSAITGVIGWWNRAQIIVLSAITQPVFLAVWILLTSGICMLVIGWLFTLWRISFRGSPGSSTGQGVEQK
jgi:hypothetical protein